MQVTIYEYSIKDGKLQKTAHAAVERTTPRGVVYEFKREQHFHYADAQSFKKIVNNRIFAHVENDDKYRKMFQELYREKVCAAEKRVQQYKEILEGLEGETRG